MHFGCTVSPQDAATQGQGKADALTLRISWAEAVLQQFCRASSGSIHTGKIGVHIPLFQCLSHFLGAPILLDKMQRAKHCPVPRGFSQFRNSGDQVLFSHAAQPFSPEKYREGTKDKGQEINDTEQGTSENLPVETSPQPARQESELGFFDTLDRMTSVKPAVDEKLKTIPHYVTLNNMPKILSQAIISVEDKRFYNHRGFDIFGIARAVLVNVEAGEIQEGASTITQQTVKNLFLTNDRTFTRKAEELVLSMNMEKEFDKDKILEIYLNVIYFGSNYYGIYDAAQGYFGKNPADLTIAECAMLAGLPNAPSLDSPYVDFRRAKQRQLTVIDAMEKDGIISSREAENARIEEIILAH